MKARVLLTFFLLVSSFIHAQNLKGVWRGYFYSGTGFYKLQYKYEVQIDQLSNKSLKGVTYSYRTTVFYGKAALQGIFMDKAKNIIIKETQMIELRIADKSEPCLMTCYLDYDKIGKTETLQGTFTSINGNSKKDCGGGVVYLEKVPDSDFGLEDFLVKKNPVTPEPEEKADQPKAYNNSNENLKRLQAALGVPDDGVMGPKTQAALKAALPDFTDSLDINSIDQVRSLISQIQKKPAQEEKRTTGVSASKKPAQKRPSPTIKNNSAGNKIKPDTDTKSQQKPTANEAIKPPSVVMNDTVAAANPVVSDIIQPPKQEITAKKIPVPEVIKDRKNPLVKTIVTNSPEITVELYDNGEIDGDTITVYHNNEIIAYKKGLTKQPIVLHITANIDDPIHEFVMVADNLGSIPPNTALMVIKTGGKRYELFISSDEEKNAKVVIEFKVPGKET